MGWWCSARQSKTTEKSSVMWLNTIVGRAGSGAASKALSTVRYSSIGLHQRSASGQIILPLDVEETVTCFCRFDLYIYFNPSHHWVFFCVVSKSIHRHHPFQLETSHFSISPIHFGIISYSWWTANSHLFCVNKKKNWKKSFVWLQKRRKKICSKSK